MANMNSWNVTDSNGMSHSISCKAKSFGGPEIKVETGLSMSWIIRLIFRVQTAMWL